MNVRLDTRIRPGAVAASVVSAVLCGLCCLGYAPWHVVVPALLTVFAVVYARRGLQGSSDAQPIRNGGRFLWAGLAAIAVGVILFIRKADAFENPQFWAEDAFLFNSARQDGLASHLKTHSHGQVFLAQRTIAYFGRFLPVVYTPYFYNFAALVVTLLVAAYIARARIDGLNPYVRACMALVPVAVYGTGEVYMTLVNIHWILAPLLLVIAMERDPQTRWGRIVLLLTMIVLALTGPFIVFLWPLFLWRAWIRGTPFSRALFAVIVPCVVQQLFTIRATRTGTIATAANTAGTVALTNPHWSGFIGRNYVGNLFMGPLVEKLDVAPMVYVVLLLLVYGVILLYVLRRRDFEVAVCLITSLATLGVGAYIHRYTPRSVDLPGHRYYFVPQICIGWAFLIMAARSRGKWLALPVAGLLAMAAASLAHFTCKPLDDLHWAKTSRAIGGPKPCVIFVNPLVLRQDVSKEYLESLVSAKQINVATFSVVYHPDPSVKVLDPP